MSSGKATPVQSGWHTTPYTKQPTLVLRCSANGAAVQCMLVYKQWNSSQHGSNEIRSGSQQLPGGYALLAASWGSKEERNAGTIMKCNWVPQKWLHADKVNFRY